MSNTNTNPNAIEWSGYKVSKSDYFKVDPRAVEPDQNVNITRGREAILEDDDLKRLAWSMATAGQVNPITVRNAGKNRYKVVSGFRRHKAAMWLIESGTAPGFEIQCVAATMNDKDAALKNFSENAHRLDPKPIEFARSIDILMKEHGYTRETVAEATQKSPGWIDHLLGLLNLPASLQSAVDLGELPVTTAMELGKLPEEDQEEAFEELTQEGDTRAEAAREKRREAGQRVKRGMGALKEFLKTKSDPEELGSNVASTLLDFIDGDITQDELSQLWDRFCLPIANYIQEEVDV